MKRLVIALFFLLAHVSSARADDARGIIHKVSDKGENYEDLAEFYYGKRYLAAHIRLFNRRPEPLAKGTTIIIPTYTVVPLKRGQTLVQFAADNLGDPKRSEYLAELMSLSGKERQVPKLGTRLKVVQSLKHVVRPGESLQSIARLYYRDVREDRLKLLTLYNSLPNRSVHAGMSLRIPLDSPEFNPVAVQMRSKKAFERSSPPSVAELASADSAGTAVVAEKEEPKRREVTKRRTIERPADRLNEPKTEIRIEPPATASFEVLAEALERTCSDGDYPRCDEDAKHLLDTAPHEVAVSTKVEILRERAVALVALGHVEESKTVFRALLKLDPAYDLDLYRTSPKILDVFQAVAER